MRLLEFDPRQNLASFLDCFHRHLRVTLAARTRLLACCVNNDVRHAELRDAASMPSPFAPSSRERWASRHHDVHGSCCEFAAAPAANSAEAQAATRTARRAVGEFASTGRTLEFGSIQIESARLLRHRAVRELILPVLLEQLGCAHFVTARDREPQGRASSPAVLGRWAHDLRLDTAAHEGFAHLLEILERPLGNHGTACGIL